jgi:uncharacterized protein (TIGR02246 family)
MTPKASTSTEDAINGRVKEFVNAWNKHDVRAMATLFTEDADLINPQGRVAKSRPEIEKMFRDEHSNAYKDSHMQLKPAGLRFLTPDVAVGDYEFEVTGVRDPSGKETKLQGHLTDVFKKQADAWNVATSRPMIPAQRLF